MDHMIGSIAETDFGSQGTHIDHAKVEIIAARCLKPELIESLAQADLIIFLNARSKAMPGGRRPQACAYSRGDGLFSGELTPTTLLGAIKFRYRRCPAAFLISVTGESFGFSAHLLPS